MAWSTYCRIRTVAAGRAVVVHGFERVRVRDAGRLGFLQDGGQPLFAPPLAAASFAGALLAHVRQQLVGGIGREGGLTLS